MDLVIYELHLGIRNCELLAGKSTPAYRVGINHNKQKSRKDEPMCFR